MAETLMCSKCGENERAKNKPWCKECLAKYQREYQDTKEEMAEKRGFALGAKSMRDAILVELTKHHPGGMIQVGEVVVWLRCLPAPIAPAPVAPDTAADAD